VGLGDGKKVVGGGRLSGGEMVNHRVDDIDAVEHLQRFHGGGLTSSSSRGLPVLTKLLLYHYISSPTPSPRNPLTSSTLIVNASKHRKAILLQHVVPSHYPPPFVVDHSR